MNFLSSNLRCLRKQRKLSQQQLADDLGVKRSNIAAYETKNVEPRLSLLSKIADYFSVPFADLILRDLSQQPLTGISSNGVGEADGGGDLLSPPVQEIRQVLEKLQRAVDGFRVFYEFKREMSRSDTRTDEGDIDNFLVFIDHVTRYQQQVENALQSSMLFLKEGQHDKLIDREN